MLLTCCAVPLCIISYRRNKRLLKTADDGSNSPSKINQIILDEEFNPMI
jgi:hypothetical protein